ncbi:MAG: sugar phosphate nucleotidyltransferase, partial [Motiliproteus sp.]|nr:sugar phosphate nucleotidyltransferase [Motiliproteus sp.]
VAIEEVPSNQVSKYGVVDGDEIEEGIFRLHNMVEKPTVDEAPSNLAIIGRYILSPDIYQLIGDTKPGKSGEVQITDALMEQAREGRVIGYQFKGKRFDCGSVRGYVAATNYCFEQFYED